MSDEPQIEAPMPADQPTPGQVASFDQTLAALGTNLDALITVYGGELADGEHPGISTAGLAKWLLAQGDAVALAEHLAAAIRRLHEAGAAYERGLAEGRRQATETVRAQAGLPDLVHFDRPSDFRKGVLTCLAALEARTQDTDHG